jgi:hypothetical protein
VVPTGARGREPVNLREAAGVEGGGFSLLELELILFS